MREVTKAREAEVGIASGQIEALMLLIDGAEEDQRCAVKDLNPSPPRREFARRCVKAVEKIVAAESLWGTIQYLLVQRKDTGLRPALEVADLVAQDGYLTCMAAAEALDLIGRDQHRAPPLVYFEAVLSADTVVREERAYVGPGGASWRPPIPLIRLPFDYAESCWLYNVLLHEVGHDLDKDLGLRTVLTPAVVAAVGARGGADRAAAWARWCPEILADALGVLLGGAGFVAAFASQLLPANGSPAIAPADDPHPPDRLRMSLLLGLLRACGDDGPVASRLEVSCRAEIASGPPSAYYDDCAAVAVALLDTPLRDAGEGPALRALVPGREGDAERSRWLALQLVSGGPLAESPWDEPFPWRLVPAGAALALVDCEDPTADALATIHDRVMTFARSLPRPGWTLSEGRRKFLVSLADSLELPIVAPLGGLKVPPVELLTAHDVIAFVGASHQRLAAQLKEAIEARAGDAGSASRSFS
nr:hypothetical protein [Deltaproteobacteria bacterium]